jgi:6-pyruvoyltetrahydropterin/6-carboxytetrahydropterin synthase
MYIIRKLLKFEMGHRLVTAYTTECKHMHGHSVKLELFFKSNILNEDGMIIDFKKVKDSLESYFKEWDHMFVISEEDNLCKFTDLNCWELGIKKVDFNPTAENFAEHFYKYIKDKFPCLYKVRYHETDTGYAEYFEE